MSFLDGAEPNTQNPNNKGTQVLIFLSFGIAATVLLWSTDLLNDIEQELLIRAMRWWGVLAILLTVIGILPLKEIRENNRRWYGFLRWLKFVLLWLTIIFIVVGVTYFVRSILEAEPTDNTQSTMLRLRVAPLRPPDVRAEDFIVGTRLSP